jgi:uncharacterized protein (TIGR02594 family)
MTSHPDFPGIQRRLAALGYYSGTIDEEWGPGMAAGVDKILDLIEAARGITHSAPAPAPTPTSAPRWLNLPPAYGWLLTLPYLPRHVEFALGLIGVQEVAGSGDNPTIMKWRDEVRAAGIDVSGYSADQVPWCGLFMAYVMLKSDRQSVAKPLWALNWAKFGQDGGQPELGDVLTFKRDGGGHVAIYIAEDRQGYYHILGGNQSDRVSIMRIAKSRMHSCRQPPYKTKPESVKPYVVAATGTVSTNEA